MVSHVFITTQQTMWIHNLDGNMTHLRHRYQKLQPFKHPFFFLRRPNLDHWPLVFKKLLVLAFKRRDKLYFSSQNLV